MLALAGGKGGAGKTTTALGLAHALPGTPLVVDADREMPDLHALAGVGRSPGLDSDDPLAAAATPPDRDCLVLPAPAREAPPTDRLLARLRGLERRVLVDCPAGAGPDAAAPLRAADATLLVAQACTSALRDTAKTAAMARALDAPVVGVVLSRARVTPPGVAALFEAPVLGRVPPASPPVLDDPAVGRSLSAVAARLEEASTR